MLKNLVTRKEDWKLAVIEDSLSCTGFPLLKAFSNRLLRFGNCFLTTFFLEISDHDVHILCFDRVPDGALYAHTLNVSPNLHLHDAYSDPCGWNSSPENTPHLRYADSLCEYFKTTVESSYCNVVIMLDSLTTLLNHRPVTSVCRDLHLLMKLQTKNGKPPVILGLLHSGVHDEHVSRAVRYLVSTTMSLSIQQQQLTCRSVHRRPTGKVLKETETFRITETFEVVDVKKAELQKKQVLPEPEQQLDPTVGLTFKLTLEEKEMQDRSQLVLPYTRVKELHTGEAQIFYEPDANDDFDEEDPDDDLNI